MKKALVLLSGGLDSMLAVKMLQEQGIQVAGLVFKSCFFNEDQAQKSALSLKIPLKIVDFSKKHLNLVKNPPHGYGKAANPCLDCHRLMLKKAREIMLKEDFDMVATGEVLGERPFSQNYQALLKVQELSGLKDRLLRPLSARLLPISLPEKKGWLNRSKLGNIQGKRRVKQLALAKKYEIKDFPQPSGGCILCEHVFAKRLFDLLKNWPKCKPDDIALIYLGRHFWEGESKIVLGRSKRENEKLEKLFKKGDLFIAPKNFAGPSALIRNIKNRSKVIEVGQKMILKYSKKSKLPKNSKFFIKG